MEGFTHVASADSPRSADPCIVTISHVAKKGLVTNTRARYPLVRAIVPVPRSWSCGGAPARPRACSMCVQCVCVCVCVYELVRLGRCASFVKVNSNMLHVCSDDQILPDQQDNIEFKCLRHKRFNVVITHDIACFPLLHAISPARISRQLIVLLIWPQKIELHSLLISSVYLATRAHTSANGKASYTSASRVPQREIIRCKLQANEQLTVAWIWNQQPVIQPARQCDCRVAQCWRGVHLANRRDAQRRPPCK